MTTLEQVHLLEEKVERAVAKMQQLQAENDALRNKCAELTNALSSKTEQLSSFTSNKDEIEDGIKKALDRLNFIENSVLKAGTSVNPNGHTSIQITPGVSKINEEELSKVQNQSIKNNIANTPANNQTNSSQQPNTNNQITKSNFDNMEPAPAAKTAQVSVQSTVTPDVQEEDQFLEPQFDMEPEFDLLGDDMDDMQDVGHMPNMNEVSDMSDIPPMADSTDFNSDNSFGFDQGTSQPAQRHPAPASAEKKPDIF